MAKQSRLEHEGIKVRKEQIANGNLHYWKGDGEYNESHDDALSTEGNPQGKGTGIAMGYSVLDPEAHLNTDYNNAGIKYSNMITSDDDHSVGGDYDINGRNDIGGRVWSSKINYYNKHNAYGVDSVDTTINVSSEEQYVVK